jgi:putative hydrolase of the HAD superfamily
LSKPKAVLFDLDGTLFDRDGAVRKLVEQQRRCFGDELGHVPPETYVRRVLELDAHGHADKTVVYRQAAGEFGLAEGLAERLVDHFWNTYHSFCECFPEVPPALASLRSAGLRLGIITNGTVRLQEQTIHRLGLMELVHVVMISEREGVRKPDAQIFERALRRLGLAADETWYVGDHPIIDVRGAFDAGLTAVWRSTPYWPRPSVPALEIQGIDELVRILV